MIYQLKSKPILFNVGLRVGLVLLLAEVVPGLSAIVGSQAPAGPICWSVDFCVVEICSCHVK